MPDGASMIMAIGMGGSAFNPHGAVGGIGLGNGVQYAKNASTFMPSYVPTLFVVTQDIRSTKDGQQVLVIDNAGSNAVLYSADGGAAFEEKKITATLPKQALARYGALVDANTWFVTLGNWPSKKQSTASVHYQSARVSAMKTTEGKAKRVSEKMNSRVLKNGTADGYSAAVAKTTDGGATWTTVFSAETNFYFNAIDCTSATHCVAVGEGFDQGAGAHIYQTTDGQTFTQVFSVPSTQSGVYSFMSVAFSSGSTVWVAGSKEAGIGSTAVFYVSRDGGKTWALDNSAPANIGDVTDLSFLADGTGFATAVTTFDDSTVLKYNPNGPTPTPPAPGPTSPFTPTPAPAAGGSFIQEHCQDAACTSGCQNMTFPVNTCLRVNGGGSAKVTCGTTTLDETVYQSADCTGASQTATMPLNQCLKGEQGGYFENLCVAAVATIQAADAKLMFTTKRF
eukprot:601_1